MGLDRTDASVPLAGVLVPDDRFRFRPAQSTTDEADPYPGSATPGRATSMSVVPSGTPQDLDTLYLLALRGGLPVPGSAEFGWRALSSGDYYGWDAPWTISRAECPAWSTSTTTGYRNPSVVALPNGIIIAAVDLPNTAGGSEARAVAILVRTTAGVWGGGLTLWVEVDPYTVSANFFLHPHLVALPDGTVELYHWTHDHTGLRSQLVKHVSLDSGASWAVASRRCLDTSVDTSGAPRRHPQEIAIAFHGGQHSMVFAINDVGGGNEDIEQYASRDGGNLFERIGVFGTDRDSPQMTVAGGYFVCAYRVAAGGSMDDIRVRRIGSAYDLYSAGDYYDVDTLGVATSVEGICADETGRLYLVGRDGNEVNLYVSEDYGVTWPVSTATYTAVLANAGGGYRRGCATWWRGQLLFGCNTAQAGALHSFIALWLGGYSTITHPYKTTDYGWSRTYVQALWEMSYVALDDVDAVTGATQSGAGPNPTVANGTANFAGGAAQDRTYTATSAAVLRPIMARMVVRVTDGDSELIASIANNVEKWGARVRVRTAGTIQLRDDGVGAQIAITGVVCLDTEVEILLHVSPGTAGNSDGKCSAWYRLTTASAESRAWTLIASSTTLTNAGAGFPTGWCSWAAQNDGGAYDVTLREWNYTFGGIPGSTTDIGLGHAIAPANPAGLRGREFSTSPTSLHDGVSIRAQCLAVAGDTWTIEPRHTYEAERVLPTDTPSPSRGWRSLTGGTHLLAYRLENGEAHIKNDLLGIYLDRINFRRVEIEIRRGGAWASYGIFALSIVADYERIGDALIPKLAGSAAATTTYLQRNELAGGVFSFETGAVRSILKNTEGNWQIGAAQNEKRPVVTFGGYTGGEPTGPAAGAIWYPRALIVLPLEGVPNIESVRLTINPAGTDPNPPQGYYQIGTCAIGAVQVMGWAPDAQRSTSRELTSDVLTEERSGITTREVLSTPYRRAEFSWARGSRITEQLNASNPDYVTQSTTASGKPVASRWSSAIDFDGLIAEHGRQPLVYLPRIDRTAGTAYVRLANYCAGAIYGRFVPDSYRLETIRGFAARDESVRSSVVTIVEER